MGSFLQNSGLRMRRRIDFVFFLFRFMDRFSPETEERPYKRV